MGEARRDVREESAEEELGRFDDLDRPPQQKLSGVVVSTPWWFEEWRRWKMSFASDRCGFGYRALALAVSTALALGCSGKSESGDDDDETGGTSAGGTSGFGGSSGTTSTGGAAPTGGTGAGSASCASICQRAQACPDAEPLDCASECADAQAQASSYGCSSELGRLYACMAVSYTHLPSPRD